MKLTLGSQIKLHAFLRKVHIKSEAAIQKRQSALIIMPLGLSRIVHIDHRPSCRIDPYNVHHMFYHVWMK